MDKLKMKRIGKVAAATVLMAAMIPLSAYAADVTADKPLSIAEKDRIKMKHKRTGEKGIHVHRVIGEKGILVINKNGFDLKPVLDLLGLDKQAYIQALEAGKSLEDLAQQKGVSRQQLINALTEQFNQGIDEAVKNGKVTKEEADKRKAQAVKVIEKIIADKGTGKEKR